jgi:hypothetical protein
VTRNRIHILCFRRDTNQNMSLFKCSKSSFILQHFILHLTAAFQLGAAVEWKNQYHKPKPSNGPCIDILERVIAGQSGKNTFYCLGCSHLSQATCPWSCQGFIDEMYRNCEGVSLPENYYFDPPVSHCIPIPKQHRVNFIA